MMSKKIINNSIVITSSTSLFLLATALILTSAVKNIKNKNKVMMFLSVGMLSVLALTSLFLCINQLLDWNSHNYPQEMDSYCTRSDIDGDSNTEEMNVKTNKKTLSIFTNTTSPDQLLWDHSHISLNNHPYQPTCSSFTQKNGSEKPFTTLQSDEPLPSKSSQDPDSLSDSSDTLLTDNLSPDQLLLGHSHISLNNHPYQPTCSSFTPKNGSEKPFTTPQSDEPLPSKSSQDPDSLSNSSDTHLTDNLVHPPVNYYKMTYSINTTTPQSNKDSAFLSDNTDTHLNSKKIPLKKKVQNLKEEVTKLKREAEKREEEVTKLKKEAEKREEEVTKLKKEAEKREEEVTKLKRDLTKLKREVTKLKREVEKREEEVTKLKRDLTKLRKNNCLLNDQLTDSHSEGENVLTESQTKFCKEINSLKEQLLSKDREISYTKEELLSKDREISYAKEQLLLATEEISRIKLIQTEYSVDNARKTVNSSLDQVSVKNIAIKNIEISSTPM